MKKYPLLLWVFLLLCAAAPARADESSLSVTVTPPLFQLSIGPGESWTSDLKIVNNNSYAVTYYAQVMDMQASGEDGQSKFIPLVDEANDPTLQTYALAGWVTIPPAPISVPPGASADLPFTVAIPQNAEPGGHYAAILVGTQPGGLNASGTLMKVSSYVSSLLFVNIKGNVVESGRIREFLTSQELYQTPQADFSLRFENTGNTHVRPQGDITIYNMWGKQRGQVLINQAADNEFGNVLPSSIRRFEFQWQGDDNPFDIGLYSAVVTLAYGQESKQSATATTYFWVVPVVPVASTLGVFILFILLMVWFIRRYIRRALMLEQKRLGLSTPQAPIPVSHMVEALIEPIREGVIDLRSVTGKKSVPAVAIPAPVSKNTVTARQFIMKYKLFLAFVLVLVVGCVAGWLYFNKVLVGSRGFQITNVRIQEE